MSTRAFDESLHPRGEAGRFTHRPKSETGVSLATAPQQDGAVLFVVTAHRHGTSEPFYLGFEIGQDLRPRVTLHQNPHPMSRRAADKTVRLAQRDGDLHGVKVAEA